MLVDPDALDSVHTDPVADEEPTPFGQDGVVGRVPRQAQPLGNAGHPQVADRDPGQTRTEPGSGHSCPGPAAALVSWRQT